MFVIIVNNGEKVLDFIKDENDKVVHWKTENEAQEFADSKSQQVPVFNYEVYEF